MTSILIVIFLLGANRYGFYDAEQLSVVQSGMVLNGSIPAVAEADLWFGPNAQGYFDPADFNASVFTSNFSNYTAHPLRTDQSPMAHFVERPTIVNASGFRGTTAFTLYQDADPYFNVTPATIVNNYSTLFTSEFPAAETSLDIQVEPFAILPTHPQNSHLIHTPLF